MELGPFALSHRVPVGIGVHDGPPGQSAVEVREPRRIAALQGDPLSRPTPLIDGNVPDASSGVGSNDEGVCPVDHEPSILGPVQLGHQCLPSLPRLGVGLRRRQLLQCL